jgi:hypothetical protein
MHEGRGPITTIRDARALDPAPAAVRARTSADRLGFAGHGLIGARSFTGRNCCSPVRCALRDPRRGPRAGQLRWFDSSHGRIDARAPRRRTPARSDHAVAVTSRRELALAHCPACQLRHLVLRSGAHCRGARSLCSVADGNADAGRPRRRVTPILGHPGPPVCEPQPSAGAAISRAFRPPAAPSSVPTP